MPLVWLAMIFWCGIGTVGEPPAPSWTASFTQTIHTHLRSRIGRQRQHLRPRLRLHRRHRRRHPRRRRVMGMILLSRPPGRGLRKQCVCFTCIYLLCFVVFSVFVVMQHDLFGYLVTLTKCQDLRLTYQGQKYMFLLTPVST